MGLAKWLFAKKLRNGYISLDIVMKELVISRELTQEGIVSWLRDLRTRAYTPISGFQVASIFKVKYNGALYYVGGANVENRELSSGGCAEEAAMSLIATAFGDKAQIVEGWVMGAPKAAESCQIACTPCGECRQRLVHFAPDANTAIHSVALNGDILMNSTVGELLRDSFSFVNLPENTRHLVAGSPKPIAAPDDRIFSSRHNLSTEKIFQWAKKLHSDAQVTGTDRVVILRLDNGTHVAGVSIENAAYPSSTNAMQSAVSNMCMVSGQAKIEEAWIFEHERGSTKKDFTLPTGYTLQVLCEHAVPNVKVQLFNARGETLKIEVPFVQTTASPSFFPDKRSCRAMAASSTHGFRL